MKNIPELRFPEFSGEWVEKRLGEVTKIYDGTHQTPKYVDNGIPFFSVENITQNNFTNTKFISEKAYEKEFKNKEIEKGDILITRIGDIGSVKDFDKNIKAGYYVSVALIKHSQFFVSKFLKFYMETEVFQKELYKRTLHIAFPKKINLNEISKCNIKLPPTLEEQQKIASFLSSIDEKIDIVSKKIEKLKEYKKGLLQKLLNVKNGVPEFRFPKFSGKWVEKRLGEIAVCEDNKRIPLNENERKQKKGKYPYWGSTKIMDYVDDYIFDGEYVLLSEDGGYFYDYKDKPIAFYVNGKFWANNHIHVLKINKNNNTKFIYYTLAHKNILAYIIGGTRTKLNQKDMLKIKIHIPPTLAEQQKIAEFLSSIDKQIELNEQKLAELKEYKKGLLQKMFV